MAEPTVDVRGWIREAAAAIDRAYGVQAQLPKEAPAVIAAVAELIEAHQQSVAEVVRLRDAMFDVYATAHNEGDVLAAVERMRDAMDEPWSVDRSHTALARVGGASHG